ncbi:hypothetical protein UFOVP998_49 [uncultured Caudovirales phage]|uniref:Uncharacterized protein n=1 Tax=uncultured Caudovirales phage TaxID=2100421 RepID=A0A6J7XB98_9CAUD|nr:hypothetical protein UFOVP998_49 [uncultured Caudovirales phage]CAB4198977.1 hypothetical protein UFOVP1331_10 [uncultured Caudovirales phage]CAB4212444.1 hypothetical protein UFOVP1442_3 [uncultured Caudovirales phage]CAB5228089.1 hypothetical protein UFOVP1535_48 [uncultured Caudovirales phage]
MKVAVTFTLSPLQRADVAGFLGRPGDVATREELTAFARHAVALALKALPPAGTIQGVPVE